MFKNPGNKLRIFGIVTFIVTAVVILYSAIYYFITVGQLASVSSYGRSSYSSSAAGTIAGMVIGGIIGFSALLFFAYIFSLFIVAFGELVQNTTDMSRNLYTFMTSGKVPAASAPIPAAPVAPGSAIKPLSPVAKTPVICPSCGTTNPANSNICMKCGKQISGVVSAAKTVPCPKCGQLNPAGSTFCGVCGTRF